MILATRSTPPPPLPHYNMLLLLLLLLCCCFCCCCFTSLFFFVVVVVVVVVAVVFQAVEMFTELRDFEMAKKFLSLSGKGASDLIALQADWAMTTNDPQAAW